MQINLTKEIAALQRMSVADLKERYGAVSGETTRTGNRTWLVRRIAWRLQALAEGDLSERARARAAELAHDADLRVVPPRHGPTTESGPRHTGKISKAQDDRLPPAGTVLTRLYKGGVVQVKVLAQGFEYQGEVFPSLSAVAKGVTGSHCNGFHFFRLTQKGGAA